MRKLWLFIVAVLLVVFGIAYLTWPRPQALSVDYKMPGNPLPKIHAAGGAAIERRERLIDQTIWAKEIIAQKHGRVFEDLWDAINASTNKLGAASELKFNALAVGAFDTTNRTTHQIQVLRQGGALGEARPAVVGKDWTGFLQKFSDAGWRLQTVEFRHNAFAPETNGVPARSRFYFSANFTNTTPASAALEGDVLVDWEMGAMEIARIDATQLSLKLRPGPPAFAEILNEAFEKPGLVEMIEPLNVVDLDGDGLPEIILPALNRIYRWSADGYRAERFYEVEPLQIFNGLFADFDRDGLIDFLFVNPLGIFLLRGAAGGKFITKPELACATFASLESPHALTAGDVDGDGALDIFVAQYRGPFESGNMPMPYYDANDGYPSYLLRNDGRGHFQDVTAESGLTTKRNRRVYGCSFVDLDGDGALDLVVTSDFAGVDVFRNDGKGRFADVTAAWLPEAHAFGMAHAFGDFNNDGRLDFFAAGMTSPTAERLEHLGLTRPFSKFDPRLRAKMIEGSRLYLANASGGFSESAAAMNIARTGWSWGVAAADFDNDGFLDLYVANGMESKSSVRDYDSEFWLHDIFIGGSRGRPEAAAYFLAKGNATRGQGMSYGGYDKNRLYLNESGGRFIDAAPLLGVAIESDCRNLVATDLDGDGKVDLVMTTVEALPPFKQRLRVFRNQLPDTGNWIAFQFGSGSIGARGLLKTGRSARAAALVTGDSFRSQHPFTLRFGLGAETNVESVEIKWPGGESLHLARPEINRSILAKQPTAN